MADKTPPFVLIQVKGYHSFEKTLNQIKAIDLRTEIKDFPRWISAPFPFIGALKNEFDAKASIGADHMLSTKEGSFTAPIAGKLLKNDGVLFVLIGSATERKLYPDEVSAYPTKISQAISNGITPILCVGEINGTDEDFSIKDEIAKQLREATATLTNDQIHGLHIAYDAPWINQTPWEADNTLLNKAYKSFEDAVSEVFDETTSKSLKLIYPVPDCSPDISKILTKYSTKAAGFTVGN